MPSLDDFAEILQRDEPLAPLTWLKVGGPAQFFLTPRDASELTQIIIACRDSQTPVRVLGSGSNLLVRDEGVPGAVVQLSAPEFAKVEISESTCTAGAGALLSHVISESVRAGLAGLETLAGIPGTVGGAVVGNVGGRYGDIGSLVTSINAIDLEGNPVTRSGDSLMFSYRKSGLEELIVLSATFELQPQNSEEITERLRQIWITKKASQPLASQSVGCIFKNPRGSSAGELIEKAGLKGTRIGGAEISDRHANFLVTNDGATSDDVLRLMDLVKSKVSAQFGVHLEPEVQIW